MCGLIQSKLVRLCLLPVTGVVVNRWLWITIPETAKNFLCYGCKAGCATRQCKCRHADLKCTSLDACNGVCTRELEENVVVVAGDWKVFPLYIRTSHVLITLSNVIETSHVLLKLAMCWSRHCCCCFLIICTMLKSFWHCGLVSHT